MAVRYATTPADLDRLFWRSAPTAGPFLIQARMEGPGVGVFLLRWNEGSRSFAHRRVREKPPSGGVSVCCESIGLHETLLAQSTALLDALDWNGVAMIEYKHDTRSGRDCLMEVNPRFWGFPPARHRRRGGFPVVPAQAALGRKSRRPTTGRLDSDRAG